MKSIVCIAGSIYILILLCRVVFSWIPVEPDSPWQRLNELCFRMTEPILAPVRNLVPVVQIGGMGLDLSFMIVFFVFVMLWQVICR